MSRDDGRGELVPRDQLANAVNIAGWLHPLTATTTPGRRVFGHGVRGDQAMITTPRHRLIRVPAHRGDTRAVGLPPTRAHPRLKINL